jgi:CelD/BcsL family acetyltransferase involved in cellulose biosynthesis
MSNLKHWESNGWVSRQTASAEEIDELLAVVTRSLEDCKAAISTDARFQIAYQAVLTLGTVLVRACGYRVERASHHYRTLQAIALVLGPAYDADCQFLDECRKKRNELSYCRVGIATERDTIDLLAVASRLKDDVIAWLGAHHADLYPPSRRKNR